MKLKELRLRNFRNWDDVVFQPGEQLNFIYGNNGQGKTSILEAVNILSSLRSFRGGKLDDWIKYGSDEAEIKTKIHRLPERDAFAWETDLKVTFQKDPLLKRFKKAAYINGKPYKSALGYLTQRYGSVGLGFHCVVFNPADHDLIRGQPNDRRVALDRIISAEDLSHLNDLQKYQKALEQKNTILKNYGVNSPPALLTSFEDQLVACGSRITARRLKWLHQALPRMQETLHQIAPTQAPIAIEIRSKWSGLSELKFKEFSDLTSIHFTGHSETPSIELLESRLRASLDASKKAELHNRCALVGPHRDDWQFTLKECLLATHGSQGEIRSVLLALKLSEVAQFQEASGHLPLFLLDDFSSELDDMRRKYLLDFLQTLGLQVFITTTDPKISGGQVFEISNGVCRKKT